MHTKIASGVLLAAILAFSIASIAVTARPAFAQSETKGQAWNSINSALGDAEKTFETDKAGALAKVDQAQTKYDSVFRSAAYEVDQATGEAIDKAFVEIRAGVNNNVKIEVVLNKQVIDKLIYKIAFMKIEKSLDEASSPPLRQAKVQEAAEFFTVMTVKFKYDQTPSASSQAMAELQANPDRLQELTLVILDSLKAQFTLKVKEEIVEAIGALEKSPPDTLNAQKFTQEGIMYYRSIQPDVKAKLGAEDEAELFHELEELMEASAAGDLARAKEVAAEINALIIAYEGGESSGVGAALNTMKDMLTLVDIEYADAVANGQIIDQTEYDESLLFLQRATDAFNGAEASLLEIAEHETQEVEEDLATLATLIQSKANPAEVKAVVEHALSEIEEIRSTSGVEGSEEFGGWEYIDHIHELLDEVLEQYRAGNAAEARALAIEAYLDNYEFIEADIAEEDRGLMEKIEVDMRIELVQMIDQRRPVSEVEAHVEQINTDLEVAKAIVTPEFPVALAAVAAVMAAAVVMGRFRGTIFRSP